MCVVAPPWTLPAATLTANAALGPWRPPVWVLLVAVSLVATVLPYLFGMSALQYLPVTAASVPPVVAIGLAWA
jgi:threonine/homoserine efflux transporter RhtA